MLFILEEKVEYRGSLDDGEYQLCHVYAIVIDNRYVPRQERELYIFYRATGLDGYLSRYRSTILSSWSVSTSPFRGLQIDFENP